MKKGITIIELIIAMSIFMILGSVIFFLYKNFLSQRIVQTTLVRTEGDLTYFQQYFLRLVSSAGFGIPAGTTDVVSGNGSFLTIRTLTAGQDSGTGCFRVIDANGNSTYTSDFDINGRPCPNTNYTRCLSLQKQQDCTATPRVEFFRPGNEYITLNTSSNNLSPQCLQGTQNLMLTFGNQTPQPVISCVANFKVLCVHRNGTVDRNCNFDNTQTSVVLCFFVQLNQTVKDTGQSFVEPTFRGPCLEANDPSRPENRISDDVQNWRSARWAVVEWMIDLPNLR